VNVRTLFSRNATNLRQQRFRRIEWVCESDRLLSFLHRANLISVQPEFTLPLFKSLVAFKAFGYTSSMDYSRQLAHLKRRLMCLQFCVWCPLRRTPWHFIWDQVVDLFKFDQHPCPNHTWIHSLCVSFRTLTSIPSPSTANRDWPATAIISGWKIVAKNGYKLCCLRSEHFKVYLVNMY